MKKIQLSVILLAFSLFSQNIGFTGTASEKTLLKTLVNPSLLAENKAGGLLYYQDRYEDEVNGWGLSAKVNRFGFSYFKTDEREFYTLSGGSQMTEGIYTGSSLRWFSGDDLDPEYDLSLTIRPTEHISLAGVVRNIFETNNTKVTTSSGLALRPFGTDILTLEGDVMFESDEYDSMMYSVGMGTEILQGVDISASYISKLNDDNFDPVYKVGLSVGIGNMDIGSRMFLNDEEITGNIDYVQVDNIRKKPLLDLGKPKIIEIELNGEYKEESSGGIFSSVFGGEKKTVRGLINKINRLNKDDKVAGILIRNKGTSMSFAAREELRNALENFKTSGKKIYSYFVSASQTDFYLMSLSDKIYMYPEGGLALGGIGLELKFFKGLLDKFGVKIQAIRHGKFKSAVEPFIQEEASRENIEQLETILKTLDEELKSSIAEGREISVEELNDIMDKVPYHTGKSAVEHGLVDELIIEQKLNKKILKDDEKKYRIVKSGTYFAMKGYSPVWENIAQDKIAVVYATGSIVTGKSSGFSLMGGSTMGSDTTVELIRAARKNPKVKAIVFRVDSGGGSGLASDLILSELKLAQEEDKKQVIISMGGAAASGGYWISAYGDRIFADKTTITGSIGVFALIPSVEEISKEFGINTQRIEMNKFASQSIFNDLSEEETDIYQKQIDEFYKGFVQKVAEARDKEFEEIDKIAEGRVWSGEDALKLGLIDEIGGLKEAVAYAADKAGVDTEYNDYIKVYTKFSRMSVSDRIMKDLIGAVDLGIFEELKGNEIYSLLSSQERIMMLMPYMIEIK